MAKTVLVVEDDSNIAELLRLYLEKEGYRVITATDGNKGVELFRSVEPDLVLLDLMLPGRLGRVPRHPPDVPDAHHHADGQGRDRG